MNNPIMNNPVMKERENIMKAVLGSIGILLALLFVPEDLLPEYNIIGYSIIAGLYLILATLKSSAQKEIRSIFRDLGLYLIVLVPIGILLFTNIKYKKKIKESGEHVELYRTLKMMTTIILGIQTYQLYMYMFESNLDVSFYLSIVLFSILNTSLATLLWSRIAFFITDGFTGKR